MKDGTPRSWRRSTALACDVPLGLLGSEGAEVTLDLPLEVVSEGGTAIEERAVEIEEDGADQCALTPLTPAGR